jgi:hypothetical protein
LQGKLPFVSDCKKPEFQLKADFYLAKQPFMGSDISPRRLGTEEAKLAQQTKR